MSLITLSTGAVNPRPPVQQFPAIGPPWDHSYPPEAIVYASLPDGDVVPTGRSRYWLNGDPWGVCLPPDRCPPWIPDCNTTPANMTMSYFTPYYLAMGRSDVIDWDFTARAERGHWTMHYAASDLLDAFGGDVNKAADLMAAAVSWGFFVSYWATSKGMPRQSWAMARPYVEPLYRACLARGIGDALVPFVGTELNADCSPDELRDLTDGMCALMNPTGNFPYFHFSPGYPSWQRPGENPSDWWLTFAGRVKGLAYQAIPLIDISVPPSTMDRIQVGIMGGKLYSARMIVPPIFDFVNFEVTGTPLLYNQLCDETGIPAPSDYPPGSFVSTAFLSETASCRVNYELQCCPPAPGSGVPFMQGGSGLRAPNGWPIQSLG